jgi:twitching motility protein PilI
MLLVIGHGNDAAGIVIDGLPRRMAFMPEAQIMPPALPDAAATAVVAAYSHGNDAWYEFDYAQLLDQLVS